MSQNHFGTGLIPRDIRRHPSEHIVGGKPKDDNNISNENKVSDIRENHAEKYGCDEYI